MRLIRREKLFIKKFPDSIINYCRWIEITNKNVLSFSKLIIKIDFDNELAKTKH